MSEFSASLKKISEDPRLDGATVREDEQGFVFTVYHHEITPSMVEVFTDYRGYGYVLGEGATRRSRVLDGWPPRFVSLSAGEPADEKIINQLLSVEELILGEDLSQSIHLGDLRRLHYLKLLGPHKGLTGVFDKKSLRDFTAIHMEERLLDDLSNHTSLQKLYLQHSKIKDFSSLGHLTNLRFLNVAFMRGVSDFSWVANCTQLEELWIEYNGPIEDTSFLRSLPKLKRLRMQNVTSNTIFEDLSEIPSLARFTVVAQQKRDTPAVPISLECFANHPALIAAVIDGPWNIESVVPLATCQNMCLVYVGGTRSQIGDNTIDRLKTLPNIRSVKVPGRRVWEP